MSDVGRPITVTNNSHGAVQNDFVTFSGAASLGGLITAAVLNQEYQIASIVDANSYTIEAKDTSGNTVLANSSDSGNGGGSTVAAYQLNVGLDTYVSSTGWGAGGWLMVFILVMVVVAVLVWWWCCDCACGCVIERVLVNAIVLVIVNVLVLSLINI